jgi:hydantoinase/carbamoylase family amidase
MQDDPQPLTRDALATPVRVERIARDIEELSRFGADGSGGTDRPCFSPAYRGATDWLAGRMREAGMSVRTDTAGNLIGRLGPDGVPAVVCGSHIDGVPGGGRYDGVLGVLAGVECARVLLERAALSSRALEVVAFADEEGAYLSLLGSRAMVGDLKAEEIEASIGRDGSPLREAMAAYGLQPERIGEAARGRDEIAAYVELHIEQGPILESENVDIGVVTDVVGIHVSEWRIRGEATHAGTCKVGQRSDALRAAAEIVARSYASFEQHFDVDRQRLNFGVVEVQPGASNVVPSLVHLQQEVRATDDRAIDALVAAIRELAEEVAIQRDVDVDARLLSRDRPAPMANRLRLLIEDRCAEIGLRSMRMPSGAGHDAQVMAGFCDAGMIFVPSRHGISHNPAEHSSVEDVENGAAVLHATLRALLAG